MVDDLSGRIKSLEVKSAAKSELIEITLPVWPETKRATPNSFLRSALFSATKSATDADREYLHRAIIASQQGIEIKFTGKRLNQDDLTLWEALVHLVKEQPLGNICEFSAYDILKTMQLGDGGVDRERLHDGIIRLAACVVEISIDGSKAYFSSLIESGIRNDLTGRYTIQLNRRLSNLYKQTTWLDWDQRVSLRRKPLAQFLHGYYSTHKKPYPVKIETLHKLSGSKSKKIAEFKQRLIKALDDLVEIKFLKRYLVENDTLSVDK